MRGIMYICCSLAALALYCACTAAPALQPVASAVNAGGTATQGGLPAFPPSGTATHQTAVNSDLAVQGAAFSELVDGTASYIDPAAPGRCVLVPLRGGAEASIPQQRLAWARYSFSGVTDGKPLYIGIDATPAPGTAGGSPALPLRYYVAVANYTHYQWEWSGPYAGKLTLPLNASASGGTPGQLDRYVSADGMVHCVVLADSRDVPAGEGNPRGLCAAGVNSVIAYVRDSYAANRPHFPLITSAVVGGPHGAAALRRASELTADQYVTLVWQHVEPLGVNDLPNVATLYRIYRQRLGEVELTLVGEQAMAGFCDPLNLLAGVEPPQVGASYRYFVEAENGAGVTPQCASLYLEIPLLAPGGLTATVNGPEDGVAVSWLTTSGAAQYEVWRGISADIEAAEQLGTVDAPGLSYLDATPVPGQYFWYFLRALSPAGAPGPFTDGVQGLRRVILDVTCLTDGVAGQGFELDPYQLDSSQGHLFSALDQVGTDYSPWVQWTVEPASAGKFGLTPPNQLHDIDPAAGVFHIQARLAMPSFSWTGGAWCEAVTP